MNEWQSVKKKTEYLHMFTSKSDIILASVFVYLHILRDFHIIRLESPLI